MMILLFREELFAYSKYLFLCRMSRVLLLVREHKVLEWNCPRSWLGEVVAFASSELAN